MRFVTVNMFETVFDEVTWDIHGSRPFTDIAADVEARWCRTSTRRTRALLEDLRDRGLLRTTMVTALGEFGRTPKINPAGGRDHHPGVWTILMGGGPIKGGRVSASRTNWATPRRSRPVTPAKWRRRSTRAWASTRTANCPARRTARSRWPISPQADQRAVLMTCRHAEHHDMHLRALLAVSWLTLSRIPGRRPASLRVYPPDAAISGPNRTQQLIVVEEENGRVVKDLHCDREVRHVRTPPWSKIGAAGLRDRRPAGLGGDYHCHRGQSLGHGEGQGE